MYNTIKDDDPIGNAFVQILNARYGKVDTDEVADQQKHLSKQQRNNLKTFFRKYTKLFSGKLGKYDRKKLHIDIKPNATPPHAHSYAVAIKHEEVFKRELEHHIKIGVLSPIGAILWVSPPFITPKKDN